MDIVPGIYQTTSMVVNPQQEHKSLSPDWEEIARGRKMVCFCYSENLMTLDYPELLQWSNEHQMKLNTFHFAHNYEAYHAKIREESRQNVLCPNHETVYLFFNQPSSFIDSCKTQLFIQEIDGFLLGIKQ